MICLHAYTVLPIMLTTVGLLRTDLNLDAQIRDLCVILTHAYFESDQDSWWSFSASTKPDWQDLARFGMQNSVYLTTFLPVMLIGLNVISGCCTSELIGQKFTSFLSSHICQICFLSVMRLVERMNTSNMTQIERIGIYLYFYVSCTKWLNVKVVMIGHLWCAFCCF